jgi:flagellin
MEGLATGKRINSASDDAAGLAVATKMTAQINGLNQAVRNANDGISMLQTADGAFSSVTNILQRMRELTVQAQNGTYADTDLSSMNGEYQQLLDEIIHISLSTQWNGLDLLNGRYGTPLNPSSPPAGVGPIQFFVGANSNPASTLSVTIDSLNPQDDVPSYIALGYDDTVKQITGIEDLVPGINPIQLTKSTAPDLLSIVDKAIAGVSEVRSTLGATVNRMQATLENLTDMSTHMSESRSRLEDLDYSSATLSLAKNMILQQASTAMLAQANQSTQTVLQLIKQ